MNSNHFILSALVILLISVTDISTYAAPTTPIDSNKSSIEIEKLKKVTDSLSSQIQVLQKKQAEQVKIECTKNYNDIKFLQWCIIFFMPFIMVAFAIVFFIVFYKSKEFKIASLIGISKKSEIGTDEAKEIEIQSTSRFIALLTGLTAIFISTTLIMFYGYIMVAQCNTSFDFDGLWKILAGLGIGIIPYGINVWNKNVKEEAAAGTTTAPEPPKQ